MSLAYVALLFFSTCLHFQLHDELVDGEVADGEAAHQAGEEREPWMNKCTGLPTQIMI